ncbi:sensor histidine kinase [Planobispora rosea]|uniref:histidine kinase n=1 Tax=Planobispora rosea TaxID=35762 RepID=A0A8J3S8W1_PLARO|nr:HAMP domain-containing sensor histidine kinase [Planobispora rosea]GGS92540.1 sensor histidine kinase [Planobispora rosea]GIH87159.1 sensor histidine kinase [Planobispora rosea]
MARVPIPSDEAERLHDLEELEALELPVEPDFDAIAMLASHLCDVPIALVNLIDDTRQHFRGRVGVTWTCADREQGYCKYTVCGNDLLEIRDILADERYREEAVAAGEPYVRYYAGVPLLSSRGHALGTVCVLDHRPRRLTPEQRTTLTALARNAATLLELHHHARRTGRAVPRLRELERLKEQFLSSINHELRTPMTSIRSALQLLQEGGLDEETERRFLAVMERNNERLTTLLDELLLLASLNAGTVPFTPERTGLAEIVRRAVGDVAERAELKEHAVHVNASSEAEILGDAGYLRIALRHVLDNAVKFTPPGGAVSVKVTADPEPAVEVRDTGMGIGARDLPHVLEDFYRAPEMEEQAVAGTGLGLAIADKIVRLHGGTVRLESEPGEGTCVRISFRDPDRDPGPAS